MQLCLSRLLQFHSMSKAYYTLLKVRKLMQKRCSKQQDKMETLSEMTVYPIRDVIKIFSLRSFLSLHCTMPPV